MDSSCELKVYDRRPISLEALYLFVGWSMAAVILTGIGVIFGIVSWLSAEQLDRASKDGVQQDT